MTVRMARLRQCLFRRAVENVREKLLEELMRLRLRRRIRAGSRIAIAVGSRNIPCLSILVRTVVQEVASAGALPFIIPAMGSHGGATAEGQKEVLKKYGITEDTVGAPIVSSLETVQVGLTPSGIPAYMDKTAFFSDGIIVINRVKRHTTLDGPIQSGLVKMVVVGLGKLEGAMMAHQHGLELAIREVGALLLSRAPLVAGVAVVENAVRQVAEIRAVTPEQFFSTDQELLKLATDIHPRIPFCSADLLIVQEIGKDISGTGMDLNVIGKWRRIGGERSPNYRRILVLGLTEKTNGNAMGIGLADFTTEEVVRRIDREATYANALSADFLAAAKLPLYFSTDEEAFLRAVCSTGTGNPSIIQIRNTLDLAEFGVSESLWEKHNLPSVECIGRYALQFNNQGKLVSLV